MLSSHSAQKVQIFVGDYGNYYKTKKKKSNIYKRNLNLKHVITDLLLEFTLPTHSVTIGAILSFLKNKFITYHLVLYIQIIYN